MVWYRRAYVLLCAFALWASASILWTSAADARPHDAPAPDGDVTIPTVPANFVHKDLGWMILHYPAQLSARVSPLIAESERFKGVLTAHFGQKVLDHVDVRIVRTPEEMAALAPPEAPPPSYGVGVAYPRLKLIVISLQNPLSAQEPDLIDVYRHELAHVALDDATDGQRVPRWFAEGLAIYQSGELEWSRTKALWEATVANNLVPFGQLERAFQDDSQRVTIAYAQSADFVRYMLRDEDRARFARFVGLVRSGTPFDQAVEESYTADLRRLDFQWRKEVANRYSIIPFLTGGSILWFGAAFILVIAYVRRTRAAKRKLQRWGEMEERQERARKEALIAMERLESAPDAPFQPHPYEGTVMVDGNGEIHTLH